MTFWELEGGLSITGVILLTISLICFLIDWMNSVSAKLKRITDLLEKDRA